MKRIVLAVAALITFTGVFAQTAPVATVIKADNFVKFKDAVHDFGKIKQGVPVTHNFVFSNITSKLVVIESATSACGCTTPVKPEATVAKGKEDKITARLNAAAAGTFNKTISVTAAGVDQPMEMKSTGELLSGEEYAKS